MTSIVDRRRRSERARMEMELLKAVVTLSVPRWESPSDPQGEVAPDQGPSSVGRSRTVVGRVFQRIGGLFAGRGSRDGGAQ